MVEIFTSIMELITEFLTSLGVSENAAPIVKILVCAVSVFSVVSSVYVITVKFRLIKLILTLLRLNKEQRIRRKERRSAKRAERERMLLSAERRRKAIESMPDDIAELKEKVRLLKVDVDGIKYAKTSNAKPKEHQGEPQHWDIC